RRWKMRWSAPAAARAAAGALQRIFHRLAHGNDVVAVHLDREQAGGDALLRQGGCAGLDLARHRDRPLVVDDYRDQRQVLRAGDVDGAVEIALGRAAVTDRAYRHALFAADLERQRGAGRVQALRGDRHRPGEVMPRRFLLVIVAALVAAPVHVDLARLHAAVQLGAVFAIARRVDVFGFHRAADADVCGFVAETAGVGAQLAGALQRDRLGVEHARGQHQLVQLDHVVEILGEGGQVLADFVAFGIKVLQVFDFELGGDGHDSLRGDCRWETWLRVPLELNCGT